MLAALLATLRILRPPVALALLLAGAYVLFRGGLILSAPRHINWGCAALALALLAPGALLLLPGFSPHGRPK